MRELLTISTKLRFAEPLDPEESVLAGNLLRLIAANQDPRPAFYQPQEGRPPRENEFWLALHYRLRCDKIGSARASFEVAEAWGMKDERAVYRIAGRQRRHCNEILSEANDKARRRLLVDILRILKDRREEVAKTR